MEKTVQTKLRLSPWLCYSFIICIPEEITEQKQREYLSKEASTDDRITFYLNNFDEL